MEFSEPAIFGKVAKQHRKLVSRVNLGSKFAFWVKTNISIKLYTDGKKYFLSS